MAKTSMIARARITRPSLPAWEGRSAGVVQFFPSLRSLRAFIAVATHQSISNASAALHISQSAVTQAVARLEGEVQAQLFERRSTGSYLNEVGQILKAYADQLLASIDKSLAECLETEGPIAATVAHRLSRRITNAQILALIAIKDSGSFLQAARRVGIAQPTIHRTARSLEDTLDVSLFATTARGSTVNGTGYRLANRLQLAIREFEGAYEKIEAQKLRERGRILVGGLLLAGSGFLASAISAFSTSHPDVNVDIATASYDVLLEKLRGGSIDFIVGVVKTPAPAEDVVQEVLAPDPYVIAARRGHPLAGVRRIELDDLTAYEWIMPGRMTARRPIYEQLFQNAAVPPRTSIETYSLNILMLLLAESDRMTILSEAQMLLDQRLGGNLAKIDYPLSHSVTSIGVTTRRTWRPSDVQKAFLDFLRHGPMTLQLIEHAAASGSA